MILVKTALGHQLFKARSLALSPRQRALFILFDGKRDLGEVLRASQGEQSDVDVLVAQGLLSGAALAASTAPAELRDLQVAGAAAPSSARAPAAIEKVEGRSSQQRYQAAYPIATRLTADLGLRGLRLNLAVEAASTCAELQALLPRILAAVGPDKAGPLQQALAP